MAPPQKNLASKQPTIAELLANGANHHKKGELQKAEAHYATILKNEPGHGDANHLMGLLAKQVGNLDMAKEFLARAVKSNPKQPQYRTNLAKLLLQRGDADEALDAIVATPPPHTIEVQLLHGVALQSLGQLEKAISQLRTILKHTPKFAPALHHLGIILRLQGKTEAAIEHGQQAISLAPQNAEFHFQLGLTYAESGTRAAAISCFEKAMKLNPNHAANCSALGIQLLFEERNEEALAKLERAAELAPDSAEYRNNLGNGYYALRMLDAAKDQFLKAIELDPNNAGAQNNLGIVLRELNCPREALKHNRRAVELCPDDANMHNSLGNTHHQYGQLIEAKAALETGISLDPNNADAHANLCVVLRKLDLTDMAIKSGKRAIELAPKMARAHNGLGMAFLQHGDLAAAKPAFQMALEINPEHAKAHSNLASLYKDFCDFDRARYHFEQALEADPTFSTAFSNMLFTMNYDPAKTGEEIFAWYQQYNERYAAPLKDEQKPHTNDRTIDRKLRIGYVSSAFQRHPAAYHFPLLFEFADRDRFEIFAYADMSKTDAYTKQYMDHCDHFIKTNGMSDESLATRICEDQVDILVDISGHAKGNRLLTFARKPAPVSLHWLDFGYTTGMDAIDYYLGDEHVTPARDDHLFGEREVWRLDGPSVVYRPGPDMGEVSPLPAKQNGYVTFCTLSRSVRLNEKTIKVWAEILKRIERSKLRLDSRNYQDEVMCDRVAEQFAAHGVYRDRLIMGFNSPPWDVLREIDIALDCFPHNSGTTLFEHLYMGNPYVTLYNRASVGTLGGAILRHAGFGEWVAHTEDEYVDIAVDLASNLDKLADIRATMRSKMENSPAMDEKAFVTRMEDAYRQMWKRYCETEA